MFGLSVNGDARAYPKRILAWHEMFVDTVGGVPVAGVYCTLCGTVILYRTEHEGVLHRLGTSGFLYRSNKLMYDQDTQSLWSTMRGAPVVGPLAGKGIVLETGPVVTTTWGEWRRRHPGTLVLSLDTGHRRDYAEGAAYRDYFATDALMFQVPVLDTRLKNKDEVFTMRLARHPDAPLAISAAFLAATPVHHDAIEGTALVVLTDPSGANRAYASEDVTFTRYDGDRTAEDSAGTIWTMNEHALGRRRRACAAPHPGAAGVLVRLARRVPEHPAGAVAGRHAPRRREGGDEPRRGSARTRSNQGSGDFAQALEKIGGRTRTRTLDPLIKSNPHDLSNQLIIRWFLFSTSRLATSFDTFSDEATRYHREPLATVHCADPLPSGGGDAEAGSPVVRAI